MLTYIIELLENNHIIDGKYLEQYLGYIKLSVNISCILLLLVFLLFYAYWF